jgi:SAM-dependent methyltransferase
VPLLFALTLLVSAALLFVVEPMIGRMVLPLLGGSPAVWNTCMVFFQASLLAGYAYAHALTALLGVRRQVALHAGLLLLPLLFLPLGVSREWVRSLPTGTNPGPWLLWLLIATVGLPFAVVSATAPLLQRWFSRTGHAAAGDPYFLYGASNIGSMLALLGYPFVVEPNLRLARQSEAWSVGYGVLVVLVLACAAVVWRTPRAVPEAPGGRTDPAPSDRPGIGRWFRWTALAFIPSSLMLGVTMYLATDIASIPLLWVIPLALYLLTFILVFARRPILPHSWMVRVMPMAVVLLALTMCLKTTQLVFIPVHLLTFFVVAMVCHGELVRHRPPARHLTGFYLAMSLGGVLGGIFNALLAPILFDWIAEYPLVLALSCLARPVAGPVSRRPRDLALDLVVPMALGILMAGLVPRLLPSSESQAASTGLKFAFGVAVVLCYTFKDRPARLALGIGAVMLASQVAINSYGLVLLRERNFFGVLRVTEDAQGRYRRLVHGTTIHGQQSLDPARSRQPLTYYHRTGPIGQVLDAFAAGPARPDVAVVGLGAGTLASYATADQHWTFYEIDPAVVRIARDPRHFTYLKDCRARTCDVILGDARLRLQEAPESGHGLIILDAFSSDAIPVHLLTREALRIYRDKLADGGVIAFHISNRHIDLAPVLDALARDAGLVARVRSDLDLSPEQVADGKLPSVWVVIAARGADLGALAEDPRWREPRSHPGEAVWTDDFSNIIKHLMIRLR